MKRISPLIALSLLVVTGNTISMQRIPHITKQKNTHLALMRSFSTNNKISDIDNPQLQKDANKIIALNALATAGNLAITGVTGNPLLLLPIIPQGISVSAAMLAKIVYPETSYNPRWLKDRNMEVTDCLVHSEKRLRRLKNLYTIGRASALLSLPLHASIALQTIMISPEIAAAAFQITTLTALYVAAHKIAYDSPNPEASIPATVIDATLLYMALIDPIAFFGAIPGAITQAATIGAAITPSVLSIAAGAISAKFLKALPVESKLKVWEQIIKFLKDKNKE